jgi:hypothetical protein
VEAEKHTPNVAGKEKEYGDQGKGDVKEGYYSSKQLTDANNHKDEFQDQLGASTPEAMPKMSQLQPPIQPILIFFEISMMVMNFQRMW